MIWPSIHYQLLMLQVGSFLLTAGNVLSIRSVESVLTRLVVVIGGTFIVLVTAHYLMIRMIVFEA